jgi:mannose-6-phosphate isomerase-like protein (cupin superfamily)
VRPFHRQKLPDHSALLSGRKPPDDTGFKSEQLQIWYNNTDVSWVGGGEAPHMHTISDECFIVLVGTLVVEVEGERFTLGPREFCCFPAGVYHAILEVRPPVETLMIRAPSIEDNVYQARVRS